MIEIRNITYDILNSDPKANQIAAEYAEECSIDGMPEINRDDSMYLAFEKAGFSKTFGAYIDDVLIGFVIVLISPNPHYGCKIGSIESIFVSNEHRKSGAGLKLLKAAEEVAKDMGAVGLFVSAPYESRLSFVMENMDAYAQTNCVFFKGFQ